MIKYECDKCHKQFNDELKTLIVRVSHEKVLDEGMVIKLEDRKYNTREMGHICGSCATSISIAISDTLKPNPTFKEEEKC